MNEIKLKVPYISQIVDIKDEDWKRRGCSIVCLTMAINYFKSNSDNPYFQKDFSLDVNDILSDAINFKFYDELIGYWIHHKISLLPHNYGIACYAEEFRSRKLGLKTEFEDKIREIGIEKIIKNILENKLVIFSMPKDFEHEDKYHSSLIVGLRFEKEKNENKKRDDGSENKVIGFYYHDPHFETEVEGAFKYVSIEKFKQHWRGLAIFVG